MPGIAPVGSAPGLPALLRRPARRGSLTVWDAPGLRCLRWWAGPRRSRLLAGGQALGRVRVGTGVFLHTLLAGFDSLADRVLNNGDCCLEGFLEDHGAVREQRQGRNPFEEHRGSIATEDVVDLLPDELVRLDDLVYACVCCQPIGQMLNGAAGLLQSCRNANVRRVDIKRTQQGAIDVFDLVAFKASVDFKFHYVPPLYSCLGEGLRGRVEGALRLDAGVVDVERDLVAGGVAAVAGDLDVAFLAYCGEGAGGLLVPELDLHDVGFQRVQNQITVDDGLQLRKQGIVLLGVIGADLALLLVVVDGHGRLAQDVVLLLHIRGELGRILLQILAQADVVGRACLRTKGGVEVVGHVLSFDSHASSSFAWMMIWIWYRAALASAPVGMPAFAVSMCCTSYPLMRG
nr:MAG TPA: hypothetical protein [Caudoviricetes sp.]